jgi:uncharacterized protein YkwD
MTATRILTLFAVSFALFSCAAQQSNAPLPASSAVSARGTEERVVSYVNASRGAAGKRSLARDVRLDALAGELARSMAKEGRLTHAGFHGRFEQAHAKAGATLFAENTHRVAPGGDPARRLVEEWLASAVHRNNILNGSWNLTGVAAVSDSTGRVWAAQVFAAAP